MLLRVQLKIHKRKLQVNKRKAASTRRFDLALNPYLDAILTRRSSRREFANSRPFDKSESWITGNNRTWKLADKFVKRKGWNATHLDPRTKGTKKLIEKFSSLLSFLSWTDRSTLLTSGIKSGFPSSSCAGEMCGNSHNRAKPSHGTGLKAESPLNFSPRVPCRFTTGGAWCVSQGNSPPRSAIRSGFNVEGSGHSCIRGPVIHRRRSPTLSLPSLYDRKSYAGCT